MDYSAKKILFISDRTGGYGADGREYDLGGY